MLRKDHPFESIMLFIVMIGLWQSADETSHDILARLAIVHMVHEAR